jgi:ABC-type polysaccharide/polyol phosphate export permease
VVVLVQYVFTLACALVLSALTVHFRDIKDILANLLMLWFFATPIIYSYKDAPALALSFMDLNPFAHLAISYQEILFFPGPFGHWKWLVALGGASVVFFLLAYWVFDRLRDSFAEEV